MARNQVSHISAAGWGRRREKPRACDRSSTVKIEPNVIASEAEPTARLSVGRNLTDDLSLVYSDGS